VLKPRRVLRASKVFKNIYLCRFDRSDMARCSKPEPSQDSPTARPKTAAAVATFKPSKLKALPYKKASCATGRAKTAEAATTSDQCQQPTPQSVPDPAVEERPPGKPVRGAHQLSSPRSRAAVHNRGRMVLPGGRSSTAGSGTDWGVGCWH